jgi:hypothetical protein
MFEMAYANYGTILFIARERYKYATVTCIVEVRRDLGGHETAGSYL